MGDTPSSDSQTKAADQLRAGGVLRSQLLSRYEDGGPRGPGLYVTRFREVLCMEVQLAWP